METAPAANPDTAEGWYRAGNRHQDEDRDDLAAECYERAVQLDPGHAKAWNNLGASRHKLGRGQPASDAYRRALEIDPFLVEALRNLAGVCRERGDAENAEPLLARAAAIDPSNAGTWEDLGRVRALLGRKDAAMDAFRAWLERDASCIDPYLHLAGIEIARNNNAAAEKWFLGALQHHPGNSTLNHMLAAVRGEATARPGAGYVEQLFDGMAEDFDRQLHQLGYKVPEMMARVVLPVLRRTPRPRVLDLGCGTGAVAAELASADAEIIGVDVSALMLERAGARRVYSRLIKGDVVEEARKFAAGSLDAVFAADVFVYLGDLASVFEAVARALAPGGMFVFSVESHERGDFFLKPNGRYAHSAGYLRVLASRGKLSEHGMERIQVRIEHGVPVDGWLAAFVR